MATISPNRTKVLVAMSGGVDSAVAAFLLKSQGYDCIGAMMKLHDSPNLIIEIEGFKQVCRQLDIPSHVIDMRARFRREVVDYFVRSYTMAKTPNPCVICNKTLKFGALRQIANNLGCSHIATGHYAQIVSSNSMSSTKSKQVDIGINDYYYKHSKGWKLCRATDCSKDQSYFLHVIKPQDLSSTLFPLGKLSKPEVRKIASNNNLACAKKSESQDICFIENGKYREFLKTEGVVEHSGKIVDKNNTILGEHNGLSNYTIGQRKGLGVSVGKPIYVCKIDKEKNQVVLGSRDDALINTVNVNNLNWLIDNEKLKAGHNYQCQVKLRYRQTASDCTFQIINNQASEIEITLKNKAFAPASGQFAVLYDGPVVLGGGTIQ